ncbi:hypothetical protein MSG28_004084 [Choristoneura fumiferana]|uniref:Uncharacterized protein n=1 Tax=Choristoneura fumiferana TaxID=7141 RepID=A0ACC0KH64_CHOFU|nr:hypothetical protein MSG28_004084 [Choristoneura fumiferana]
MKYPYLLSIMVSLIIFFSGCYAENETKLFMVADVVRSMQRPTAVIAMLCWSSRMNKQLYSALGGNVTHITLVQFLKTGAIPQRHAQDQHIFFLADLDCPGISSYLELSSLEKYFRSPFRWLLVGNGYNSEINFIPKALEGVDILADSEVILAQHLGDGSYGLHLSSPMFFTTERMTIVDYIWSPTPTRSKFIFRQPKLSYETNLFILSFRAAVWYCTIGLLIMLVLAIFVAAHWEWKKTHRHENMKGLFAFHMETGVGYKFVGKYFQESEKCGLKEIQYLQVIDPWLAVRKNTPFKEMFKIGSKRIAGDLRCYACTFSSVDSDRSCLTVTNDTLSVDCPYQYCTIMRQEFMDPIGEVASFTRGCDGIQSVVGGSLNPNPEYVGDNLLVPGTRDGATTVKISSGLILSLGVKHNMTTSPTKTKHKLSLRKRLFVKKSPKVGCYVDTDSNDEFTQSSSRPISPADPFLAQSAHHVEASPDSGENHRNPSEPFCNNTSHCSDHSLKDDDSNRQCCKAFFRRSRPRSLVDNQPSKADISSRPCSPVNSSLNSYSENSVTQTKSEEIPKATVKFPKGDDPRKYFEHSGSFEGNKPKSKLFVKRLSADHLISTESKPLFHSSPESDRSSSLDRKRRNYLYGRLASHSLLGAAELEHVFPDREVTIFVGTWNMNGQAPPKELADFIFPNQVKHVPDIFAIGTQESYSERTEWEITIQEVLGPSHLLLHSYYLGTIHLTVFIRRDLIWFCSLPEDASLSVRPGTAFRTKGAVAISFALFGSTFLFVTAHLTAHQEKYDPGSQQFDTSSKQRAPAYTDRILYKARTMTGNSSSAFSGLRRISSVPVSSGLKCAAYNSVQSICTSDHKPVWGLFSAALRPGTDVVPLAAGLFNREVYLEGIKRRRALLDHAPGTSAVCSIQ